MLKFLPPVLRGLLALVLLLVNTLFWCAPLLVLALVKPVLPLRAVRLRVDPALNAIAGCWVACNGAWMRLLHGTAWDVQGVSELRYRDWYLVTCNHQSSVDILVLQRVLSRRIPLLKFFLKRALIYVPVLGLAWYALDFPFMLRQTKSDLRRHPERRLADRAATRRACEKFALVPTSVVSFAEGTRFTARKHQQQDSPYRHLLKVRAGALALTLHAMGERFQALLDVTIVYPGGAPTLWQFLCGRTPRVVVRVRRLPIPDGFCTRDYAQDREFRRVFQQWLSDLWQDKDRLIESLLDAPSPAPAAALAPAERGRPEPVGAARGFTRD